MGRAYLPRAAPGKRHKQRGSLSSHLLVLALGTMVGAGVMWLVQGGRPWWLPTSDAAAVTPELRADGGPSDAVRGRGSPLPPVFHLALRYTDGASARVPAVTLDLGDDRLGVVTALGALIDASAVLLPLGDGRARPVNDVLAVAPSLQLVMLGVDAETAQRLQGLRPAGGGDAGLHLGRTFDVLGAGGWRESGFIDSPAQRSDLGAYWYAMNANLSAMATPAAVVDSAQRLLGIAVLPAVAGDAPETRAAVDLQGLAPLLTPSNAEPEVLETFIDAFFATDEVGRLLTVEHAAARDDWAQVIAGGADLMYLAYPLAERVRPLLEQAYQVVISDALAASGGVRRAQEHLAQAARLLGWSAPRRVLAARTARAAGDVQGALRELNAAQSEAQGDPQTQNALREAARRLVSDLLANNLLGAEEAVATLQSQLALDPDYADYHAALGQRLFELARYRDALPSLYRARALDGARYGEDFSALIALAQERLYAPGVTIVPVQSQGATLFVNGTIPGTSGTYRFILDTGASITAISPRIAAQLPGLVNRGSVRLSTANGQVDAPLVTLPSLDVAGARVAQLDVVVLDSLASYDGLLGLSFLDHFNMELDRNRNEMTLRLR